MLRRFIAVTACLFGASVFAEAGRAQSPAVSALNGNFALEGGSIGNSAASSAIGIVQGSLTAPVGQSFGMQIDGGAATAYNVVVGGGGLHAFWRDPVIGLIGPIAAMIATPASRTGFYVGEGELYAGRVTVGVVAGYQDGVSYGSARAASGGFYLGRLALYPMPDLALSIEGSSAAGRGQGRNTVEYQPGFAVARGLSLFVDGSVGEASTYSIMAGARFYFGADKPLIRRHREDDPHYTTFDGFYSQAGR